MALSQSLWSLNSQQPLSPNGLLNEFELEETLYKNIAADPQERDAIRKFLDQGIQVKIQVIPADKVVDVAGLL